MIDRRQFLRFGAATLVAAPFVRLLGDARAGGDGLARRLLVFHSPNGTIPTWWRPTGSGAAYAFAPGSILEPLAGYEEHLQVLTGLDFSVGDNHEGGMASMLTAGGQTSLDQVVADAIGGGSRFRSLELGALTSLWGASQQTRMSLRDGALVSPDDDPLHAWRRLFGDLGDERLLARRQSVLDLARGDLASLNARLGASERARLDAHLESLRSVERSLEGGGGCDDPIAPEAVGARDNDAFPTIVKAQIDLAVQALACDVTRVASVQCSHTVSPVVFTWLGETEGHHALSHADDGNTAGVASFVRCERWFAEQFAYLLDRLLALPDPETGAPLLDSTIVLWAKELGDSRMHVCRNVPWVVAGGAAVGLRPGRAVAVTTKHDAILAEIANRFGLGLDHFGTGANAPAGVLG